MSDVPPPIPAATLVVLRDTASGPPELLMVERAATMAFAAGAMVFPGGRVDPGDHELAQLHEGDRDDTAARIAAIRETVEEAGIAIGLAPAPSSATTDRLRQALHGGAALGEALHAAQATLDLSLLVPFARWRPDHVAVRRFDTRFYLARLPAGSPPATVDATENVRLLWSTAADVLAQADAARAHLIYPTRRTLERLAQFDSIDAAWADAAAHPVRLITPFLEDRGGEPHLCIPHDLGYPVTAEPVGSVRRG